jgi:hypothetical protein
MTHAGETPQRAGAGVNRAPYRRATVSAGGGGGTVLAAPVQRRDA